MSDISTKHLAGKAALVTGASRGIGRAIALKLAKAGAKIAINFAGNFVKAEEVKAAIEADGGEAMLVQGNVANFEIVDEIVRNVTNKFGKIDILVNNAGITRDNLLIKMSEYDFDMVVATNLKGVFNCTKAVTRMMLKQRSGRIINLTSVVALNGNIGQANYAAAKAGIIGFTKSSAREFASRGITVNAIAPGFIDTDMTATVSDKLKEEMLRTIPMGRTGIPEDVANLAVFLASEQAAYITGQVICVDGGMAM